MHAAVRPPVVVVIAPSRRRADGFAIRPAEKALPGAECGLVRPEGAVEDRAVQRAVHLGRVLDAKSGVHIAWLVVTH